MARKQRHQNVSGGILEILPPELILNVVERLDVKTLGKVRIAAPEMSMLRVMTEKVMFSKITLHHGRDCLDIAKTRIDLKQVRTLCIRPYDYELDSHSVDFEESYLSMRRLTRVRKRRLIEDIVVKNRKFTAGLKKMMTNRYLLPLVEYVIVRFPYDYTRLRSMNDWRKRMQILSTLGDLSQTRYDSPHLTSIKSLTLVNIKAPDVTKWPTQSSVSTFLKLFKDVRRLYIHSVHREAPYSLLILPGLEEAFKNVQELGLSASSWSPNRALRERGAELMPNLRCIQLFNAEFYSQENLVWLLSYEASLEHLELWSCKLTKFYLLNTNYGIQDTADLGLIHLEHLSTTGHGWLDPLLSDLSWCLAFEQLQHGLVKLKRLEIGNFKSRELPHDPRRWRRHNHTDMDFDYPVHFRDRRTLKAGLTEEQYHVHQTGRNLITHHRIKTDSHRIVWRSPDLRDLFSDASWHRIGGNPRNITFRALEAQISQAESDIFAKIETMRVAVPSKHKVHAWYDEDIDVIFYINARADKPHARVERMVSRSSDLRLLTPAERASVSSVPGGVFFTAVGTEKAALANLCRVFEDKIIQFEVRAGSRKLDREAQFSVKSEEVQRTNDTLDSLQTVLYRRRQLDTI